MTYHFFAQFADISGIIGVVLVLIAYFCLNTNRMSAIDLRYQLLNFIGSWLILYSLYFSFNLASVIIEIAWILISVIGIYRCYKIDKQRKSRVSDFKK